MTQANPSAGLVGSSSPGLAEQAASQGGATEHVAAPAPHNGAPARTYRVWARMMNRWVRVFATDDYEKALHFAEDHIRHTARSVLSEGVAGGSHPAGQPALPRVDHLR